MLRPGKQQPNGGGLPHAYGGGGGGYGGGGGGGYGGTGSSSFGVGSGAAYDHGARPSLARRGSGGFSSSSSSWIMNKFVWLSLLSIVLLFTTLNYRSKTNVLLSSLGVKSIDAAKKSLEKLEHERNRYQEDARYTGDRQRGLKESIREMERENRKLQAERDKLRDQMMAEQQRSSSRGANVAAQMLTSEDEARLQAREAAWKNQVFLLQNATAREAKRAAIDRFGPGPHHVKITLKFPEEEQVNPDNFFVAEMAPLETMPHAVHLFLEQVRHELWDGTYIYLNGPHVCQAGPQDYAEDEDDHEGDYDEDFPQALKKFRDLQLDKLVFPEYHDNYPHEQWTMGFTGRPGGPDWYINKMNNTKLHGPGGQQQHVLEEQGDPCFGIIMEGRETLQKVFRMKSRAPRDRFAFFLDEPVEIVSARIQEAFPDQEAPAGGSEGGGGEKAETKEEKKQRARRNRRPRARPDGDNIPEVP